MSNEQPRTARIVAGVDGSRRSEAVLAWAVAHARRLGDEVVAVLAWQPPTVFGDLPPRVESDLSESAEKRMAAIVAGCDTQGVVVTQVVQEGGPVRLLTQLAAGADLLVLGRHGGGSDDGPDKPLGSVVNACVAQAPCPTAVVPVT